MSTIFMSKSLSLIHLLQYFFACEMILSFSKASASSAEFGIETFGLEAGNTSPQ